MARLLSQHVGRVELGYGNINDSWIASTKNASFTSPASFCFSRAAGLAICALQDARNRPSLLLLLLLGMALLCLSGLLQLCLRLLWLNWWLVRLQRVKWLGGVDSSRSFSRRAAAWVSRDRMATKRVVKTYMWIFQDAAWTLYRANALESRWEADAMTTSTCRLRVTVRVHHGEQT
jgi:hypothetical protein